MRIGELAKAVQVPEKTIRYYEARGLFRPTAREPNGYRHYEQGDLDELIFIRRCRELGISLGDIEQLMQARANAGASCANVDEIIGRQLEKVRHTLQELHALEATLSGLRGCDGETVGECRILRQLGN